MPPRHRARSAARPRTARLVVLCTLALSLLTSAAAVGLWRGSAGTPTAWMPVGHNVAAPAELVPPDAAAPAQSRRPNIVTIVADDMRTDDLRWMPSVRRLLVNRGLTFRNSFSPFPLCCPARASILSGMYAHNHEVYSHLQPYGFGAFDDSRTVATSLNESGYNTIALGKYLNGYGQQDSPATGQPSFRYVPPGWTDWRVAVERPANSGYATGGPYNYWDTLFNVNGQIDDSHRGDYQTSVLGRMAREAVQVYSRSPKPFFLYVAPVAPHVGNPVESDDPGRVRSPLTGRRESLLTPARPAWVRGRFDRQIARASGLPRSGGPSEADVSDKPRPINRASELDRGERLAIRELTRQRAEALYVLDEEVRRLVATLEATGELANTVIMFTSDNGYFLGEHRQRQGKVKPHEPSLRVPFVVAGKGVPRGQRFDPVTTAGLTATILDLAEAPAPHPGDGTSVRPSFRRDRGWRVPVVTENMENLTIFKKAAASPAPGFTDARTSIGIRTPRWKLVHYIDGGGELYDLDRDPNELDNRFGQSRFATVQAQLETLWQDYKDCSGVTCRAPMPASLQRTPAQNKAGTDKQSRGVLARYGYRR